MSVMRVLHGGAGRWLVVGVVLLLAWQGVVWVTGVPRFILPSPLGVGAALTGNVALIGRNFLVTALEIGLGLLCGTVLGATCALVIDHYRSARRWLMPVLVASQAVPVFALAPLLVLWLGYGMVSKVAMATLIIFFPVMASFLDGLRRTEPGWVDLARTMTAAPGRDRLGNRLALLRQVRIPAALPALASGLRVAVAVAPIGAVIGEWVGSSAGLGYLMLHANARMQTDLMFAALLVLSVFAVLLWVLVDGLLRRLIPWQADSLSSLTR